MHGSDEESSQPTSTSTTTTERSGRTSGETASAGFASVSSIARRCLPVFLSALHDRLALAAAGGGEDAAMLLAENCPVGLEEIESLVVLGEEYREEGSDDENGTIKGGGRRDGGREGGRESYKRVGDTIQMSTTFV